jgi:pimeloyl-ACP methyl ester carboxylesterase
MDAYYETLVESFDQALIWYRCIGSQEPTLVLCDGIACDGFVWKYLIPYFENQHRIIHWNYRGHGKTPSPKNWDNLGIEECAQDLCHVLDHARIQQPVVLLGHSMGVQVILEFYHRYPERVLGLIPVTGPYGKAIDHIHDTSVMRRFFPLLKFVCTRFQSVTSFVNRTLAPTDLVYWYALAFEVNHRLIKKEDFFPYLEHMAKLDPALFMRMLERAARHTAEPYLADIKVPTLIIGAERDCFTPYWITQRMHAMIPGSQMLTLPQGSHAGPIELPELTNLRIEKFLAQFASEKKC